jgi:cyclopropane fatty-acyl-phospholipid synthase-like methyltransferase
MKFWPESLTESGVTSIWCLQAARSYGCEVDTLTLSAEQKVLAEKRVRDAGLEHKVRIHLLDYRSIPAEFEKAFDAFVSIEMLEVTYSHYSCRFIRSCGHLQHVGSKVCPLFRRVLGAFLIIPSISVL